MPDKSDIKEPLFPNRNPTIIYIFGGSGDLSFRKLMPALYNLFLDGYMPPQFQIIGIGRSTHSETAYHKLVRENITKHSRRGAPSKEGWKEFSANLTYIKADLLADRIYKSIRTQVSKLEEEWGVKAQVIYYMSVAPQLAPEIATRLHKNKICSDSKCCRIVFEKPFGHDLKSATELNTLLGGLFLEEQIYRIDHYLGKETVQNILALRFGNALFEPVWNSNFIDHVQITASENIGVEDRGGYYEQAGALRDMVQNHILQILCMVAMEAPVSFEANEIRNKKIDVLKAIRRFSSEEVHHNAVRGQYKGGWNKGKEVKAYREEKGVSPDSSVETFAAVKLFVDNWRWKDVPFYVRTGKALNSKATHITIRFKPAPKFAFPNASLETWRANRLTISIAPKMEIRLRFQTKRPGQEMSLQPVDMTFSYTDAYGGEDQQPEAYETLLEDVIEGNATLFMRADQIEEAWKIIEPILQSWQSRPPTQFPNYDPGSWGPEDAEALIARNGHNWVAS